MKSMGGKTGDRYHLKSGQAALAFVRNVIPLRYLIAHLDIKPGSG
jgi:hypothetical protein